MDIQVSNISGLEDIVKDIVKDIESKVKPKFKKGDFVWAVNPYKDGEVTGARIGDVSLLIGQDLEQFLDNSFTVRVEYIVFFGKKIVRPWVEGGVRVRDLKAFRAEIYTYDWHEKTFELSCDGLSDFIFKEKPMQS